MKQRLILIALILALYSCKKFTVGFDVSQPENTKEQKEFPKRLIGVYYNVDKNIELEIEKYFILKRIILDDTLKISDLDKTERVKNDTLYKLHSNTKYKILKINDSLFSNYIYVDTTFNLKTLDLLKKFKGYYFLNHKTENGSWEVEKLSLKQGVLKINGIRTENEISMMETITESKRDTIKPFIVKPTKKQFKAFVKQNGFTESDTYIRQ
jgi:hypothetical protein